MATSSSARPRLSRRHIADLAGMAALVGLVALFLMTPAARATEPQPDACAGATWEATAPAGENPYPMLTVTVGFVGDVPDGCSLDFSMASYDTDGPTWPTSGTQRFLDFDTGTIDAINRVITLTVAEPACFGQTDFYTGSTRYDGVDGPLPHYPDVPTPYGKISGSGGGEECAVETTPPPTPTPTDTPTPTPDATPTPTPDETSTPTATPDETPTPTGSELPIGGVNPTPRPTGGALGAVGTPNVTPPATDAAPTTTSSGAAPLLLVLGAITVLMTTALVTAPARVRRNR